jgi:DNA-binding NtrC family response regulator
MSPDLKLSVLVVDDDANICRTLSISLRDMGCEVIEARSVDEALKKFQEHSFDLVLTDFRMEEKTGLDLVKDIRRLDPQAVVVVMTAFASIDNAVSVIREGAFDYLAKPFTTAQLSHLLTRVSVISSLKHENSELKRTRSRKNYFAGLTSPASLRLEEFIRKVAPSDATVLLVGESGTGKSELARLIHEWSPRARHQLVTVQCTSLAESLLESELFGHVKGAFTGASSEKKGKLELANGGSLFLDEIGDMPLAGQAKLLRFLQERVFERVGGTQEISVDTRIIAATNKNLEEAVRRGKFRDDLYYRLNILECTLVPLRFRKEEIPVLLKRFVNELRSTAPGQSELHISEEVTKKLLSYSWPGNIRELRNALERAMMLSSGKEIRRVDLPEAIFRENTASISHGGVIRSLEELEREHIEFALSQETNLEKVAERLGITTVTLWRKRKHYGLS